MFFLLKIVALLENNKKKMITAKEQEQLKNSELLEARLALTETSSD